MTRSSIPAGYVTTSAAAAEIREKIGSVCHVASRVPQSVFTAKYKRYIFAEFNEAIGAEMWHAAKELCESAREVTVAVLDPDPELYFLHHFGHYGAFRIAVTETEDTYWNLIAYAPPESPADSLLFNSNVIVWVPDSGEWVAWGQHDHEICVFGFPDNIRSVETMPTRLTWYSSEAALQILIRKTFRQKSVPTSFAEEFRRNYP